MKCEYTILEGKLKKAENKKDVVWIEVINPSEEELEDLISTYGIPEDYLLDVNDPDEVSRVEGLEDDRPNLFILTYPIKELNTKYITRVVSIIIFQDVVITVRNQDSKVFDNLKSASFHRVENDGDIENFVIELAWRISKGFIDEIKKLNLEIENLENKIKKTSRTDFLYDMINIQKSLINFDVAIKENNPVIKSIFEMENFSESEYREELLHDLLVENKQAEIMIDKSTIMVDKLSDLYSNVINNNLNTIMKVLTSITIVMTVPTIIGGLWGMNVKLPLENNPMAFLYLILLTIIISIIIILYLKKRDYL